MLGLIFKNYRYYVLILCVVLVASLVAVLRLPVNLLPSIYEPKIQINQFWDNASAPAVETHLVAPLEKELENIVGVKHVESDIYFQFGETTVELSPFVDQEHVYQTILQRVRDLPNRPEDAQAPRVRNLAHDNNHKIGDYILVAKDAQHIFSREAYTDIFKRFIEPEIMAITGVVGVYFSSDPKQAYNVAVDPFALAQRALTLDDVKQALQQNSQGMGSSIGLGTSMLNVKMDAELTVDNLHNTQIHKEDKRPVFLHEVATIQKDFVEGDYSLYTERGRAMHGYFKAFPDCNYLQVVQDVLDTIDRLNVGVLDELGLHLELHQNNATPVQDAVALVSGNLFGGILLATAVLLFFIRRFALIAMLAVTVPIATLMTCGIFALLGRSMNIMSLAGIALATGMILDASIIVMDNILRLKHNNTRNKTAVLQGTNQVTGALVASALTGVIVFLPILFIENIEAQLFHDLAIAIVSTMLLSLLLAITLVPLLLRRYLLHHAPEEVHLERYQKFARFITKLGATSKRRLGIYCGCLCLPILLIFPLLLPLDGVPPLGSQEVLLLLFAKDGITQKQDRAIFSKVRTAVDVYKKEHPDELEKMVWVHNSNALVFRFIVKQGQSTQPFITWLKAHFDDTSFPFYHPVVFNPSFLDNFLQDGRQLLLTLSGASGTGLREIENKIQQALVTVLPDANISLESKSARNQMHVIPRETALQALNIPPKQLETWLMMLSHGQRVAKVQEQGTPYDLNLVGAGCDKKICDLLSMPLYFNKVGTLPLSAFADIELVADHNHLKRIQGYRVRQIALTPSQDMDIQHAQGRIEKMLDDMRPDLLAAQIKADIKGGMQELTQWLLTMSQQVGVAIILLFLMVACLLRSFKDSLVSLCALPLTFFGGCLGLFILSLFTEQKLDMITLIGFIIVLGLTVNNAILLVSQFRQNQRMGKPANLAIQDALQIRARAILMSSLTSILGVLPLAIVPGVGAEIYRGLAAVIAGGMTFSLLGTTPLMAAILTSRWYVKKDA